MTALIDTNVLVYRFDPRAPVKQQRAIELLRQGIAEESIRIAHQAVVEFYAAVTRSIRGRGPLLAPLDAQRETEELLVQFPVVYPTQEILRTALRGMQAISFPGSTP